MQKRTAAAGTALVLAASVTGLAATGSSAQAGTHQSARSGATAQIMKVTSNARSIKLSAKTIRPGNTVFKVYRGSAGGQMQMLRLKKGYSLTQAAQDIPAAFGGNVPAVKRVDNNVVFYGGINAPAKGVAKPNQWGINLDKRGTYYVVNFSNNGHALAQFTVKGTVHHGALPKPTGWVNATGTVAANHWVSPATDPHRGWMKTTNKAQEPHFPVLDRVKESTTHRDVQNYINSGGQGAPPYALRANTSAGVISPGHTMVWKYALPAGKYIVECFFPGKTSGMPHFFMGMYRLFHLS